MLKLTYVQENAVNQIIEYFNEVKQTWNNNIENEIKIKIVQFTAPTGSGKTFMIANIISKIIDICYNQKLIFVIFTLSSTELPKQFENKLKSYQYSLVNKFNVKYWESPSNSNAKRTDNDYEIKFTNKDVLIFGTQSFGKNRIFTTQNKFKDFIKEAKDQDYKIVYIRDEAHIGDKTNNKYSKTEQDYINENADFIIKMTATPNLKDNCKNIFIFEKELNDEMNEQFLLKTKCHLNYGFKNDQIDDNVLLDTAINQFKKVKNDYNLQNKNTNNIINPAMLIQISSKNKDKKLIKEDSEDINQIIEKLNENNLSWVIYLSNRKESSLKEAENKKDINLNSISKNNSNIDVIIFKIGPAIGWDIPRACMLLQLRKVCSDTLKQQTTGRIKRNPLPSLEYNKLYNQYWIYSNHQEKTRAIHRYVLNNNFKNIKFPSIIATNKDKYQSKEMYLKFYNEKIYKKFISENNKQINEFLRLYKEYFCNKNKKEIEINKILYFSNETKNAEYKETLKNFLDIKIYCFNIFNKNQWLKFVLPELKQLYQEIKNQNQLITYDQFLFIFLKDYLIKINKLKNEFFNNENKYEYKIEYKTLPEEFIIYEGEKSEVNFKDIQSIYAYRNILFENEEIQTIQYLDSKPEKKYLDAIIETINNNFNGNIKDKIEVIAKNPLQSEIFCEYWNKKESRYAKSYIDFIIKIKDKNQYYYAEVKSKLNDYDYEKTDSIKNQFIKYSKSKFEDNNNLIISLSLAYIDINESTIERSIDDKNLKNEKNQGITVTIPESENNKYKGIIKFIENLKNQF